MALSQQRELFTLKATITRGALSGSPVTVFAGWPCNLKLYGRMATGEDDFQDNQEGAVHVLTGPYYRGLRFATADLITSLVGNDGVDYVSGLRTWSVVGRQNYRTVGDQRELSVYVREPV